MDNPALTPSQPWEAKDFAPVALLTVSHQRDCGLPLGAGQQTQRIPRLLVKTETANWAKTIKAAGIKADCPASSPLLCTSSPGAPYAGRAALCPFFPERPPTMQRTYRSGQIVPRPNQGPQVPPWRKQPAGRLQGNAG